MKCEQLEGFPSIVTEVHSNNPLREKIETQLDNLSDKANEILAAVKECCDCEEELEQGKKVEKAEKTQGCKSSS